MLVLQADLLHTISLLQFFIICVTYLAWPFSKLFYAFGLFWFSYKLKVTGEDYVFTENGVHTATHMH